jgi:quinol monooxygenase YgiN
MPQIQTSNQPVTQITIVEAEPGKQAEALSLMTERARFMSKQPGFVSISLHRSLDGRRIVNYVQWRNREQLQSAHKSPDFGQWRAAGTGHFAANFGRAQPPETLKAWYGEYGSHVIPRLRGSVTTTRAAAS